MGRVGSCFDNAAAEAFFSSLEWEVLSRHDFADTRQAQAVVLDWCLGFYNHDRRQRSGHDEPDQLRDHRGHRPGSRIRKPSTIRGEPHCSRSRPLLARHRNSRHRRRPRTQHRGTRHQRHHRVRAQTPPRHPAPRDPDTRRRSRLVAHPARRSRRRPHLRRMGTRRVGSRHHRGPRRAPAYLESVVAPLPPKRAWALNQGVDIRNTAHVLRGRPINTHATNRATQRLVTARVEGRRHGGVAYGSGETEKLPPLAKTARDANWLLVDQTARARYR